MNTRGIIVGIAFCLSTPAFAQVTYSAPLRLIHFNGTGALKWTNDLCTTAPVYDVLRAYVVTGAWEHFFYVTNADSATVTNSLGSSGGAVFHKLAWINDAPTSFNYTFEEGYGTPAVTGQLIMKFVPGTNMGTWFCEETGAAVDHNHPTGTGPFVQGGMNVSPTNHFVRLYFTPLVGDSGVYLEGAMQQSTTNGKCIYTGFSGTVYQNRLAGPASIGTFTAARTP